ncbi:MAG: GAF domain-containing protein [Synechococcales bacterium]|nr:GAF domain-containing protein [Synechococcales bacterium]
MDTTPTSLHERLLALEMENAELRSHLQTCEQAYAFLQAKVTQLERQEQNPQWVAPGQGLGMASANAVSKRSLDLLAQQVTFARLNEVIAQERVVELAKANESLQRSLNRLAGDRNLESFLGQVIQEAIQVLDGEAAQLFLYDARTHTLAPSLGIDEKGFTRPQPGVVGGLPIGEPFPADLTVAWQRIRDHGKPAFYDIDRDPEIFWPGTIEWHRRRGEQGVMATALVLGEQPLGILGLTFTNRTEFTEAEFALFQALAQQATLAIQLSYLKEEANQATVAAQEREQAALERAVALARANDELTQRDRLLAVVAQVTQELLENPDVDGAIAQALQKLGEAAGASRVNLLNQRPEAHTGRLQHHVLMEWTTPNTPRQMDDPATHIVTNDDVAAVIAELHAGRPVCLYLEEYPETIQPQMAGIAIKVSGIAPIFIEGEYFGCLCFDNCDHRRLWSDQEMDVLTTGAGAIGAALLRQRLADRLIQSQAEQKRAAELARANDALKRSLDAIATDANPRQMISHILRIVAEQFQSPLVEYWSHSTTRQTAHLDLTYWQGTFLTPAQQPGHPGNVAFPCFSSLVRGDLASPSYFLIQNVRADRYIASASQQIGVDVAAWFTQRGVTCLLNIPLWLNEKTIGALDVWLPGDRSFTQSQIELACTLGQQITLATYLNQLFEEAKQTVLFEERNRIAGDIHDALAQAFTGISLQLEVAKPLVQQEPETVAQILQHISQLTKNGLEEARRSVWALYPPGEEYANLAQKLYDSVEQMSRNTPISLEVTILGNPCPLSPYMGMNLLRIGQEALTNALKHSQAQTVWIELIYTPDLVSLSIRDDGRGFIPPTNLNNLNGGFGLVGMYERCDRIGAQLSILSQPGQGTQILVELPLN